MALPMRTTNRNITILKGLPEDAEDFTNLTLLSDPVLLPAICGSGVRSVIQNLFHQRKNLFSFEHSYFIAKNGVKAGMILGYDWKTRRRESWRTGLLLIKFMKLGFFTKFPTLLKVLSVNRRVETSEYYISNIAVYPEFRGSKLGRKLLLEIEREAKRYDAKKITLDVSTDNQSAIRLYSRLGYSIAGKPKSAKINQEKIAFFRMCKDYSEDVA